MQKAPSRLPPWTRVSAPITAPTRSSSSASHVAPRAIETGKQVEPGTTTPRGPSQKRTPGSPSRGSAPPTNGRTPYASDASTSPRTTGKSPDSTWSFSSRVI
jgi:hypothetical protein